MEANCYHCGRVFNCKGADKYCSVTCRKTARQIRAGNRVEEHKTCPNCNNIFIPENRSDQVYCSDKCRNENKAKKKNIELTEKVCVVCGLTFMPVQNKQICCSKKCVNNRYYAMNIERKKQQAKEWRKNNPERARENDRRKREQNKEMYDRIDREYRDKVRYSGNRESVVDRDSRKCTMCGSDYILSVHHKDHSGQTENRNDDPDNLTSLCSHCHGKQHGRSINPEIHITSTCLVCGKEFNTTTYLIEGGRGKYCSAECQKKRNSKTNTVTLNCEYCGKEFTVPLSRYKRGKVKYDSMECRRAAGYAWTNKQATN